MKVRNGFVRGEIRNRTVRIASNVSQVDNLQPGQTAENFLTFNIPSNFRSGTIEISYYEIKEKLSTAAMDFSTFADIDKDGFYGALNHNGDSYNYLTETPPNLGEVEFPLRETKAANIILKFNGYWGTFSRATDTPPGPTLHKNWTWTAGSHSLREKLNELGF